ncbi:MAG: hypothetical protein OHK0046_05140 [Anaerolineae bacterium]
MKNLRRWQLDSTAPYALHIAADARLSQTDYEDDQSWELSLGLADTPALSLQTQYGGRVGLASLVPMWWHDNRAIYQAQTYAKPPVVVAFAPAYLEVEARLTPELALVAEYWVMESHAVGARFTIENRGTQPAALRLDLFGHVGAQNKEQPLAILSLANGTNALSMGRMNDLEPVVVLENATAQLPVGGKASPKIGCELKVAPGEKTIVRWVHAGLGRMLSALERAQYWLAQDWDAAFAQIDDAAAAVPVIDTGDVSQDAAIAFSYMQLVHAFLRPTHQLPHASFVANRTPAYGYNRKSAARGWSGQLPHVAYLVAPAIASIAPAMAYGVLKNYLAVQAEDGSIDMRPGLGGQRQDVLCPPLLARLAWEIWQNTHDNVFLRDVFPGLTRFLNRWSERDLDTDGDVLPEWQDERQTGYVFWPTFGAGQPWAQNLDIRRVETPDMAAYLLSELRSLQEIGLELYEASSHEFDERIQVLQRLLERLWYKGRYAYQDRDGHNTAPAQVVLEEARADEEHILALKLDQPARLVVHVSGGTGKTPAASLLLEGLDADGGRITEEVDLKAFSWGYGGGGFTSSRVYAQVDRVRFTGLSRVFRVSVHTVDLTRLDINAVLPLWSGHVPEVNVAPLVNLVMSAGHFVRPGGLTIVSAQDPNFDPASARGGGGTWPYWTTLIAEGLLAYGKTQAAVDLLKRLLKTQTEVLRQQKRFSEFYHSDEPIGLGETSFLSGIVPLHLLMKVLGVRILNPVRVWTGGAFVWGAPVTVRQHGVTVYRASDGTQITFPTGHQVTLNADAPWQEVVDPTTGDNPVPAALAALPTLPESAPTTAPNRVIIQVEHDDN